MSGAEGAPGTGPGATGVLVASILVVLATTSLAAAPPPVPATPAGVEAIVEARPFVLDEPFAFTWRAEAPEVRSGHLVVLAVEPALVYPRQVAEPVLYVGGETAWRLNVGYRSGRVVALVPGELRAGGPGAAGVVRVWFGTPELPERVDAARIAVERRRAEAAGVGEVVGPEVRAALVRGGERVRARDLAELLAVAAEMVREHSPAEGDVVRALAGQGR